LRLETEFLLLGWGLLGVIVVTALTSGSTSKDATNKPYRSEQDAAADKNVPNSVSPDFAALIHTINDQAQTNRGQQSKEDQGRQFREYVTIVVLTITMIVLVITYNAISDQVAEMQKVYEPIREQAVVARQSLEDVQRAFIYRSSIIAFISDDTQIIGVEWKNSGSTPGLHAKRWTSIKMFPGDIPKDFTYPDLGTDGNIVADDIIRPVTFVGPLETQFSELIKVSLDAMRAVRSGQFRLFTWGWIEYDDVFPNTPRHRTEFCNEIVVEAVGIPDQNGRRETHLHFPIYGAYNTAN